jgi:hypothetical protein
MHAIMRAFFCWYFSWYLKKLQLYLFFITIKYFVMSKINDTDVVVVDGVEWSKDKFILTSKGKYRARDGSIKDAIVADDCLRFGRYLVPIDDIY